MAGVVVFSCHCLWKMFRIPFLLVALSHIPFVWLTDVSAVSYNEAKLRGFADTKGTVGPWSFEAIEGSAWLWCVEWWSVQPMWCVWALYVWEWCDGLLLQIIQFSLCLTSQFKSTYQASDVRDCPGVLELCLVNFHCSLYGGDEIY